MNIGKRIRALREAKGLSQGDVERRSGLLRSYISRVEGGYTAPSVATLEKFAKALEVDPYQLLYARSWHRGTVVMPARRHISRSAMRLLGIYEALPPSNRKLVASLVSKLTKA